MWLFAMLEEGTMTDAKLRHSVIEFICKWRLRRVASYQELLVDSAVEREIRLCLPKAVPMWLWIRRRLVGDMYMTAESWTIHVVRYSILWGLCRPSACPELWCVSVFASQSIWISVGCGCLSPRYLLGTRLPNVSSMRRVSECVVCLNVSFAS